MFLPFLEFADLKKKLIFFHRFKKEEEEAEVKLENEMTQKIQMILALKQVIETKKVTSLLFVIINSI